jgi:hypothetical protein
VLRVKVDSGDFGFAGRASSLSRDFAQLNKSQRFRSWSVPAAMDQNSEIGIDADAQTHRAESNRTT